MIIRKYKKGDEFGILKLDRLVEEHIWNRRNLKNWFWKFNKKKKTMKSIVFVCEKNNKIIATFAILPIKWKIYNKEFTASHSIAMIVHPNYQNKGLIKFVADKVIQQAKIKKYEFVYGYPNHKAYDLHKKLLGYEDAFDQKLYHVKIKNKRIAKNFKDLKLIKTKFFDKSHDKLWQDIKNEYPIILKRSKEFLNWRYAERPDHIYFIFTLYNNKKNIGYMVLKIYQEKNLLRGHIIDIFVSQKNLKYFNYLIDQANLFFKKKNCQEITMWLNGSNKLQQAIKLKGFKVKSSRKMICKFDLNSKNYKNILDQKKWYFTMGDTFEIF
jgi:predicted N-acetyltransferase YhbS